MMATNHGLTGAALGLAVHEPVAAVGLALGSHFILDAMPHFGSESHASKGFLTLIAFDLLGIIAIISLLAGLQPDNWQLAIGCAVVAMIPDVMWLPNWLLTLSGRAKRPHKHFLPRFHKSIQWAEKPNNWPVEIIWGTCMAAVVAKIAAF